MNTILQTAQLKRLPRFIPCGYYLWRNDSTKYVQCLIETVFDQSPTFGENLIPILLPEEENKYSIAHINASGEVQVKSFPYDIGFLRTNCFQNKGQAEKYVQNPRLIDEEFGVFRPVVGLEDRGPFGRRGRSITTSEFRILLDEGRAFQVLDHTRQQGYLVPSNSCYLAYLLCEQNGGLNGNNRVKIKELAIDIIRQGYLYILFTDTGKKILHALAEDGELASAVVGDSYDITSGRSSSSNCQYALRAKILEAEVQGKGINDISRATLHDLALNLIREGGYKSLSRELLNDMQDHGNVCLQELGQLKVNKPDFEEYYDDEVERQGHRATLAGFHSNPKIGELLHLIQLGLYHQLAIDTLELLRANKNVGLMLLEDLFLKRGNDYALNYLRELYRQEMYDQALVLLRFIPKFDRECWQDIREIIPIVEERANTREIDRLLNEARIGGLLKMTKKDSTATNKNYRLPYEIGIAHLLKIIEEDSSLNKPLDFTKLKGVYLIFQRQYDLIPTELLDSMREDDFIVKLLSFMMESPLYKNYARNTLVSELDRVGRGSDARVVERGGQLDNL